MASDNDQHLDTYLDYLPIELTRMIAGYLDFREQFALENVCYGFRSPIRELPDKKNIMQRPFSKHTVTTHAQNPVFPMVAACNYICNYIIGNDNKFVNSISVHCTKIPFGNVSLKQTDNNILLYDFEYTTRSDDTYGLDWSPCGRYLIIRQPRKYRLMIIDIFEKPIHDKSSHVAHYSIVPLMSQVFARYLLNKDCHNESIRWPKRTTLDMAIASTRKYGTLYQLSRGDPTTRGGRRSVRYGGVKGRKPLLPKPAFSYHPSGKFYAVAYDGERIALFKLHNALLQTQSGAYSKAYSHNSYRINVGSGSDRSKECLILNNDELPVPDYILPSLPGESRSWLHTISWSPCGNYLAIIQMDGNWHIWNNMTSQYCYSTMDVNGGAALRLPPHILKNTQTSSHHKTVQGLDMAWEPVTGRYLAIVAAGVLPVIWDSVTRKCRLLGTVPYPHYYMSERDTNMTGVYYHNTEMCWFRNGRYLLFMGNHARNAFNGDYILYDVVADKTQDIKKETDHRLDINLVGVAYPTDMNSVVIIHTHYDVQTRNAKIHPPQKITIHPRVDKQKGFQYKGHKYASFLSIGKGWPKVTNTSIKRNGPDYHSKRTWLCSTHGGRKYMQTDHAALLVYC